MTILEYEAGQQLHLRSMELRNTTGANEFYSLLQALMRAADSYNMNYLKHMFPDVAAELKDRYSAPGGKLPSET